MPGVDEALELEQMLLSRRSEERFAAEDEPDWNERVSSSAALLSDTD